DFHPAAGTRSERRSRRNSLTAMSASVTGERSAPLVQRLYGPRAVARATSPAVRITVASGSRSARRLLDGNGQSIYSLRRRIDAVAEFEIIGGRKGAEHLDEMPCYRHFAYGIGAFAVFNPEA